MFHKDIEAFEPKFINLIEWVTTVSGLTQSQLISNVMAAEGTCL